jgi:2-octaprenyl-6-methoxyphenol hydroxylase
MVGAGTVTAPTRRHGGMMSDDTEVVVVGGGPAGLTAALAIAAAGVPTVLVAAKPRPDNRTTALHRAAITALETLGAWERCRYQAAALSVMRIIDDTARLIRAPEVSFSAAEIGYEAFGYNIENKHLVAALEARAAECPAFTRVADTAVSIELAENGVTVHLAGGGGVHARLAVAADGRHSLLRSAAGIAIDHRTYPQTALTINLRHTRPHQNIATEFHTETGPFTLVPLPGLRSSLVCVVDRTTAVRLSAVDDAAIAVEIERRSHSILGKIAVETERGAFPLEFATAHAFGARRVALVGEAAHVIPPIGAQGLNLGLRDAAMIAELTVAAHRADDDVGSDEAVARYDRMRRADIASRTLAVDLLNRSLLSDVLPVQGLRGLSLYLIGAIAPMRQAVMREGIAPVAGAPRLMRGEAL